MPNNKKQIITNISNTLVPSTIAACNNKKINGYGNYNQVIQINQKFSPTKGQEKRIHLSPQSSCGSSTGSAFSSYCTTSCNSSTCSKRNLRSGSSSDYCTSNSHSFISGSSLLSCESSDCHSSSKYSSNTCSNSNVSSYSSLSNSSSVSSGSYDEPIDDGHIKNFDPDLGNKKRFTRSSISNSSKNSSWQSNITNSSFTSINDSISNNSIKSNSTIVTAKITRSSVNSLKASNCQPESFTTNFTASDKSQSLIENDNVEKKKCMWNKCNYIGNSTEVDNSLVDHIKSKHIFSQKHLNRFRCLWKGCTVYQKPAYHFNWLERHVVDHIEKRPFMCIFNGCKRKFRTEEAREKHCQSHIGTSEKVENVVQSQPVISPTKTRSHLLLNNAKIALIQNIKNKNNTATSLKSAKPQTNYSQILKTLTKKRKTQALAAKKFKKAHFKDFIDDFTVQVIENKLNFLEFKNGKCNFKAEIIGSHINNETNTEMFLVQWNPKNILENEWLEKKDLRTTKELSLSELPTKANRLNPFYRSHRFRTNRRK